MTEEQQKLRFLECRVESVANDLGDLCGEYDSVHWQPRSKKNRETRENIHALFVVCENNLSDLIQKIADLQKELNE